MCDLEKVIRGLECCNTPNNHEDCPYNGAAHYNICTHQLLSDAISLLKAQEPQNMIVCNGELYCPKCWNKLKSYFHYCEECGQAVKWDE